LFIFLAGAVSFGGLMLLSRERVPKTYIPMISLGNKNKNEIDYKSWRRRTCLDLESDIC